MTPNFEDTNELLKQMVIGTRNSAQEPTAEIRAAANAIRQIYVSLTNAGFTRDDALILVGYVLTASMRAAGN